MSSEHGVKTEEDVRRIAAVLGLPDFVYIVPKIETGGSTREVGDALLAVGGRRAMVQVKSRQPDAEDDGAGWVRKAATRATRQASGSHRSIRRRISEGRSLTAYAIRTVDLPVDVRERSALLLQEWPDSTPTIVVLDHPRLNDVELPANDQVFYVSLDDWGGLYEACRSVFNVVEYITRVLASGTSTVLGRELDRYERVGPCGHRSSDP